MNPLNYPLAILAGGLTLAVGVRWAYLSNTVVIPAVSGIAVVSGIGLEKRKAEIKSRAIKSKFKNIRPLTLKVAASAEILQAKANNCNINSDYIDILAQVNYCTEAIYQLPNKINLFIERISQTYGSLSDLKDVRQEIKKIEAQIKNSQGELKTKSAELLESLKGNLALVERGNSLVGITAIKITTLLSELEGGLQQIDNLLRFGVTDPEAASKVNTSIQNLRSTIEKLDLLLNDE